MVTSPDIAAFPPPERLLSFPARRRDPARPLLSIVVPVFNEEECLRALHQRLVAVLDGLRDSGEIVYVNDGSQDNSLNILRSLAERDPRVGYASFSRNFGHEAATSCGLARARGQTVVIIDADLQDPPEVILELIERWRNGYDIIYAQRRSRAGETVLTQVTSHLFYRLLRRVAKVEIPVDTGDFRLMDRKVVDAFNSLPERTRFVRGMISWTGFRQTAVQFNREPRLAGQTKYDFVKRARLAIDAICGMSAAPLRAIHHLGLALGIVAIALALVAVPVQVLRADGWPFLTLLVAGLFGLASVQLLALGLVGEYVGRIYVEVQARPLFLVAESRDPSASQANAASPLPVAG